MQESEILAFDFRYFPVNTIESRYYWIEVLYHLLEDCNSGSLKVGFENLYIKINKFSFSKNSIYIRLKNKDTCFLQKDVKTNDVLYVFYLCLSFFPLPRDSEKRPILLKGMYEMKEILKIILQQDFKPSDWVRYILYLIFKKKDKEVILPEISKKDKWVKWLRDKKEGKKIFYFRQCTILLLLRPVRIELNLFHKNGEKFIFFLPRNKNSYRDLYVLNLHEKRRWFWGATIKKRYQTFSTPDYVDLTSFF